MLNGSEMCSLKRINTCLCACYTSVWLRGPILKPLSIVQWELFQEFNLQFYRSVINSSRYVQFHLNILWTHGIIQVGVREWVSSDKHFDHLWFWCLAQGYLGSALKAFQHFSCYQPPFQCLVSSLDLKQKPCDSQSSPIHTATPNDRLTITSRFSHQLGKWHPKPFDRLT